MKRRLPCALAILLRLGPLAHAADDPVVAERGADRLTLSQARTLVAGLDPAARAHLDTPPALTGLLRDALLRRAVLAQAQAQKWDRRPDVAALVQRARDAAVAQSFLAAQAPLPRGYPTDADIEAAYTQNKPRFMQPRAYHLSQLFLPAAPAAADAARHSLAGLKGHIDQAHPMQDAAAGLPRAAYNDLGWLPETQIAPAVKDAVAGLQEGATTDPICTPAGCHLIHLVATRPAGPAPLPSVRETLVGALRQARQEAAQRTYLDALLAQQPVRVNEIVLPRVAAP